jgi:hypothetical protein
MARSATVAAAQLLLVGVAVCQQPDKPRDPGAARPPAPKTWDIRKLGKGGSSESYGIGDYEVTRLTKTDLPEETHNPTAQERDRLRVEWGEAVKDDSPFEELLVRGRLLVQSPDGKSRKPVTWPQGVRVVMARSPDQKPDWTKRLDTNVVAWGDAITGADGLFEARVPLAYLSRVPGKTAPFRVTLCLGVKSGKTITWKSNAPVLAQTAGTIRVPGPSTLSSTHQILCAAPGLSGARFDSLALVRAVNHLQALGKEKAVAELRAFLKVASKIPRMGQREPGNIDTSDRESVLLVVQLLFEPATRGDERPIIPLGYTVPMPSPEDAKLWPLWPLAVQQDVPFLLAGMGIRGGPPYPPEINADWAEKHGKLRAKPLRPADDPLAAVDALCAAPQTARLYGQLWDRPLYSRDVLRHQAWRMIEPIVGPWQTSRRERVRRGYDPDADWDKHKKVAARFKLRWDEKEQKYVAR